MKKYLDIVKHVLDNGKVKKPVRRNADGKWEPVDGGVSTLACPNVCFSHDMSEGFPLLTSKKMAWKAIRVELEGFIRGVTSKTWFQDRGCKIWDEWGNPKKVRELLIAEAEKHPGMSPDDPANVKIAQQDEYDLGPIYGYQWRRFNQAYDEDDNGWTDARVLEDADQLKRIVETLRTNPMDRRMVCSAWNPLHVTRMALPPCHYSWNVTVIGDELNLFWAQRSCDLMLGVPFNIASYALLLELLAHDSGFKPGNLSGMLVDCHIYENQLEAAAQQITREPNELPTLKFDHNDIFNWRYQDAHILDYNPLPKIDFGAPIV